MPQSDVSKSILSCLEHDIQAQENFYRLESSGSGSIRQ